MAGELEVASLLAKLKYRIDTNSAKELDKFQKSLKETAKLREANAKALKQENLAALAKERFVTQQMKTEQQAAKLRAVEHKNNILRLRETAMEQRAAMRSVAKVVQSTAPDTKSKAISALNRAKLQQAIRDNAMTPPTGITKSSLLTARDLYGDTSFHDKLNKFTTRRLAQQEAADAKARTAELARAQRYLADHEMSWRNILRMTNQWRGAIIAGTAAFTAWSAASGIAKMTMDFDRIKTSLTAVTGDAQLGAKQFEYLTNQSLRLGLNLQDVSKEYSGLFASAKSMMNPEEIQDLFTSVTEYGKSVGTDPYRMKLGLVALQQMASKGKISAEELRRQLGESMPGAVQIFARALNMTDEQLFETMEKGKLLSKDVLPKVSKEFAKAAREGNALGKRLNAADTYMVRMITRWQLLANNMEKTGFNNALKYIFDLLDKIAKIISPLATLFGSFADSFTFWFLFPIRLVIAALHDLGLVLNSVIGDSVDKFMEFSGKVMGVVAAIWALRKAWSFIGGVRQKVSEIKTNVIEARRLIVGDVVGGSSGAGSTTGGTTPTGKKGGTGRLGAAVPLVKGVGAAAAAMSLIGLMDAFFSGGDIRQVIDAISQGVGMFAGGAVGSLFGPAGTAAGSIAGGTAVPWLVNIIIDKFSGEIGGETFETAVTGINTKIESTNKAVILKNINTLR